jgi:hypothetical protein
MSDDKTDSLDPNADATPPPSPTPVPDIHLPADGHGLGPDNGPINEPSAAQPPVLPAVPIQGGPSVSQDTGPAPPSVTTQVTTQVDVPVLPPLVLQPVPVSVSVLSVPGLLPVLVDTTIVDFSFNEFVDGSGVRITNQKGTNSEGDTVTKTLLDTLDASANLQITEDLSQVISTYDGPNGALVAEIRKYASEIQCSKFQGNGTIEDYSELFNAAASIANESKQMQLSIDIDGFNEFANAADQLSSLFTGFILKLQNVNIINDFAFLTSILAALRKIVRLSDTFGEFKEAIVATSLIEIPKSCHETSVILGEVMDEINCAVGMINHFVSPVGVGPEGATLDPKERIVIDTAVRTIQQWNILCEQGVSIAMSSNVDIQNIARVNSALKVKTSSLNNAVTVLTSKFSAFHL